MWLFKSVLRNQMYWELIYWCCHWPDGELWASTWCLSGSASHLPKQDHIYSYLIGLLCTSVQFSRSVVSDSLWPHGLQHAMLPCPSHCQNLFKLMSIESVIPSSHLILCRPFLLLPSVFPSISSFPVSQFFTSGGQSIGVSALASVPQMNV